MFFYESNGTDLFDLLVLTRCSFSLVTMTMLHPVLEQCASPDDPDVVKGVLSHIFRALPPSIAANRPEGTMYDEDFCFVSALRELEPSDLVDVGMTRAAAKLIIRAV